MLISCCEIFAPKPVSHSHTPAEKDALLLFKEDFFFLYIYDFFFPLLSLAALRLFVDGDQHKSHTEISPTADDRKSHVMPCAPPLFIPRRLWTATQSVRRGISIRNCSRGRRSATISTPTRPPKPCCFSSSLSRHCSLARSVPLPAALVSPPASSHKKKKCEQKKQKKNLDSSSSAKSHV